MCIRSLLGAFFRALCFARRRGIKSERLVNDGRYVISVNDPPEWRDARKLRSAEGGPVEDLFTKG